MNDDGEAPRASHSYPKVPALTAAFWAVKVLTTGLGESASDYLFLGGHWIALILTAVTVVGAFVWQFRTDRYQAVPYWTAILGVAIFGTAEADIVAFVVGIPLPLVAAGYALATAGVLTCWYRSEGTLSVHSITTRRRETFYWLTVMCSFALGTAMGDLTADTLGLGLVGSIALFGVAILVPWVLHRRRFLHPVTAFWAAYVLTRPLNASVADWLLKPVHDDGYGGGGIGLGAGTISFEGLVLFAGLVAYLTIRRPDVQEAPGGTPRPIGSPEGTTKV
ncbi:COG4705 family protein [Streptomyces sp. NBC_00063]|uniref:COG4705 family protein n=1 Tax=Streptomyces sp. NBC_00063 TaxID=2975638 RepID=UPI003D727CA1